MSKNVDVITASHRHFLVLLFFIMTASALLLRAIYLQHYSNKTLLEAGQKFQRKEVVIPTYRGPITDRNGELLAISTPLHAVWIDPRNFDYGDASITRIAETLSLQPQHLQGRLEQKKDKRFVYVKRQVTQEEADALRGLDIRGVHFKREYRRYYPMGEAIAHLIGVTDIDDIGIEGIEKAFDGHLRGISGRKLVEQDRFGRTIKNVEMIVTPQPGKNLALSIDHRIQYRAYKTLKTAVRKHHANWGSLVVLDTRNGEVLAMVNQPSFNPNDRRHFRAETRRNRAVTDIFEPGSTVKPLVLAALLRHGLVTLDTPVDVSSGRYVVAGNIIQDIRDYGELSAADILVKSSNVGISKLSIRLLPEEMWQFFAAVGFGQIPGTGFPGEAGGTLPNYTQWRGSDQAMMSFGYGLSVSVLQLAHAYTVIANNGWQPELTFYKLEDRFPQGKQILSAEIASDLRHIMRRIVSVHGTGAKAKATGFSTAGKTGTVRKYQDGQYAKESYLSVFAGFVPANDPRLVIVALIDNPGTSFYGGAVAAPVFAEVAGNALRILGISDDDIASLAEVNDAHYIVSDERVSQ